MNYAKTNSYTLLLLIIQPIIIPITYAEPPICEPPLVNKTFIFDDMENWFFSSNWWETYGDDPLWFIVAYEQIDLQNSHEAWFTSMGIGSVQDKYLESKIFELNLDHESPLLEFDFDRNIHEGLLCSDGLLLEVKINDNDWMQIDDSLFTQGDPYDNPISEQFNNPAAGLNAWCGDSGGFVHQHVNLESFMGSDLTFRFRAATDSNVGWNGVLIDNIHLSACAPREIFADGFEII